jgi:hypothetical protein
MAKKLTIRELTTERLPVHPRWATTDRPVPKEAESVIKAAQAASIRRARGR